VACKKNDSELKSNWIIGILLGVFFMAAWNPPFTYPSHWPAPHYAFEHNAIDSLKRELGRALFYDPILSADSSVSCASCHSPYQSFAHTDHAVSHGINDQLGNRNAPVLINLAWQRQLMHDGAIAFFDFQPLAPITHPKEMGETLENVLMKLNRNRRYQKALWAIYQDSLMTSERMLKCLSQFLLSLVSANSKYDQVQLGITDFNEQERSGYRVFQAQCASCHTPPLFTNFEYANNGISIDPIYQDSGRYQISHQAEDIFRFKVPTLRNIEFSYPYMHDGRYPTLRAVLQHYRKDQQGNDGIADVSLPLHFSEKEETDLMAFLLTLSDPDFNLNKENHFPRVFFSGK
jgi:cytochrome c peroxidase